MSAAADWGQFLIALGTTTTLGSVLYQTLTGFPPDCGVRRVGRVVLRVVGPLTRPLRARPRVVLTAPPTLVRVPLTDRERAVLTALRADVERLRADAARVWGGGSAPPGHSGVAGACRHDDYLCRRFGCPDGPNWAGDRRL